MNKFTCLKPNLGTAKQIHSGCWFDISYRFSENWATGPAAVIYDSSEAGNMLAPSFKGYALGWNGNYYFNSVLKNCWYLSLHSYYEKFSSYPHAYLGHEEREGFKVNTAIGYQWKWSATNLMAGFGSEYRNHNIANKPNSPGGSQPEVTYSNEENWLPFIELKIGIQI